MRLRRWGDTPVLCQSFRATCLTKPLYMTSGSYTDSLQHTTCDLPDFLDACAAVDQPAVRADQEVRRHGTNGIAREDRGVGSSPDEAGVGPRLRASPGLWARPVEPLAHRMCLPVH
jgi:hypothetical protein